MLRTMTGHRTSTPAPAAKERAGFHRGRQAPRKGLSGALEQRTRRSVEGLELLAVLVAVMWIVEVINALDANRLDTAGGLYARNVDHLWAIFTSPFLHAGFGHLIGNTIPFVFMGAIIALRGAARLALVTLIVIVVGGLGTWLISPSGSDTVGASGIVFGYAGYLLTRGLFDHSLRELLTGAIVGVLWGAVLIASLIPHGHVSWQGHLTGALGGVIAAWLLARRDGRRAVGHDRWRGMRSTRQRPAAYPVARTK
jgi:membrane associated rhomboid family serine protease